MEYNLSAIPNNNCGSPTGCTGNSMVVASQGQFTLQFNYSAIVMRFLFDYNPLIVSQYSLTVLAKFL